MPFEIVRNHTTKMHVDAIVNAKNSKFYGIALDIAIHKIEGARLKAETAQIGEIELDQNVLTKVYNLPSANIFNTVVTILNNETIGEDNILRSCYKN